MLFSGNVIRSNNKINEIKDELFNDKKIKWENIYQGFTRIIYGMMKKLVIADYLSSIQGQIFYNYHTYSGIFIIYGVICYAIQIYTDFSGCMDIVIGSSQMFNVKLTENFKSPFYSKSLPEFWRRWHITLGIWSKDYIMYPLLKSDPFQKLGKFTKKKFGKKFGKKIPNIIAVFILWLIIGVWHGATIRYIVVAGIIPWFYLTCGELFNIKNKNKNKSFSCKLFNITKTFSLMCLLWLFICVQSIREIPGLFNSIFIFAEPSLFTTLPPITIYLILTLGLVAYIDYLIYNDKNPLEMFYKQNIIFKWVILYIIIIVILLYGQYGPGFDKANFIYGGF